MSIYPSQPDRSRQAAKDLLVHYLRLIHTRAGGTFDGDMQAEVESIVDLIVEAAGEERNK